MLILFKDIAAILEGFYSNLALLVICAPEKIAVPICLQHELIISNSKQKSRKDNRKTGTNAKKIRATCETSRLGRLCPERDNILYCRYR